MKRRAALQQLSREHHGALVLTQRIAKARDVAALARLLETVPATFRRELEPHFRAEEESLLPRLAAAGEGDLVRRTLADHRELRILAAEIAAGDDSRLQTFGAALSAHVRFEERELFVTAEAVLPAEYLDDAGPAPATDPSTAPTER
ncbi:MAG: hemerythrin domain-containing protein [Candidatus Accumulibacter phosphatis]|uniref:hemerythrin domain-containing protein n=1 Tax=Candidatus Accumulibacter phosphatis TaxID=327160 RepID=UPI001A52A14C|nr:hemerythrin domain-containing protein [Candidatus Accumulibacter phosphatis]